MHLILKKRKGKNRKSHAYLACLLRDPSSFMSIVEKKNLIAQTFQCVTLDQTFLTFLITFSRNTCITTNFKRDHKLPSFYA